MDNIIPFLLEIFQKDPFSAILVCLSFTTPFLAKSILLKRNPAIDENLIKWENYLDLEAKREIVQKAFREAERDLLFSGGRQKHKKLAMLLAKLQHIEDTISKNEKEKEQLIEKNREAGKISIEFILVIVPAFIAILFSLTLVALLIINHDVQTYTAPPELKAAISTIVGYYFGVGASSKLSMIKS